MTATLQDSDFSPPHELEVLIEAHCRGTSTEEQAGALDRALRESPSAVEMLCEAARQDMMLTELFHAAEADESLDSIVSGWIEALQPVADPGDNGVQLSGGIFGAIWRRGRDTVDTIPGVSALISGLFITSVLLVLAIITISTSLDENGTALRPTSAEAQIVARITASRNASWSEATLKTLDGDVFVFEQEPLELESGLVEILYDNGVMLVVEGPARFELSDSGSAFLGGGKITARVPSNAIGFAVTGPGVRVVDLGTEFGVQISPERSGNLQVFDGRVRAEFQTGSATAKQFELSAGDAYSWSPDGGSAIRSEFVETGFIRQLPRVTAIYLPDTGSQPNVGLLPVGETDSHWRVGLAGEATDWQPAKRVFHEAYSPSSTAGATWISVPEGWETASGNTVFTFGVDFLVDEGFEIDTIRAVARYASDNRVVAVRLNGQSLEVPTQSVETFREDATLRFSRFFQPGRNELQVDVLNEGEAAGPMALRWEWRGQGLQTTNANGEPHK